MATNPPQRPPWSWPGVVATILAGSLGVGWCGALIVSAVIPTPVSESGINLLGSLGQTLAGAVAAYLGYQIGSHDRTADGRRTDANGDTQDEPPTPTSNVDTTP